MVDLQNGTAQDIHNNVVYIRGSISGLENAITQLKTTLDNLTKSIELSTESTERIVKHVMDANERTVTHVKNSIPLKFVIIICGILMVAFVGGGVLKELVDSHMLSKLFGAV